MTSGAIALPLGLASSAVPRWRGDASSGTPSGRRSRRVGAASARRSTSLVARYQRPIYRLCYRYVNNHEDANDLAQEAFLKAWRAISSFRGDSAFSTWLYRIAVNACLNHRALRRPVTQELADALVDPRPGRRRRRVERDDEARRVRAAVSRLPDRQRATLILKIYHDLTHDEVAEILGSTVGTVKANLFHALGNLRRQMQAGGGDAVMTAHLSDESVVELATGEGGARELEHAAGCEACALPRPGEPRRARAAAARRRAGAVAALLGGAPHAASGSGSRRTSGTSRSGRCSSRSRPRRRSSLCSGAAPRSRRPSRRLRFRPGRRCPPPKRTRGCACSRAWRSRPTARSDWDEPAGLAPYLAGLTDEESRGARGDAARPGSWR